MEEEGWQSFQETSAQTEKVIHKVGVEFAFLAGCESSVCLLADELESFFEHGMVLLKSVEFESKEFYAVDKAANRIKLITCHRFLDEVMYVRLKLLTEHS